MAKTVGLGARQAGTNAETILLVEENKKLQAEMGKVMKEKKKAVEENKALKKEMAQLKKKREEQLTLPVVSDIGE
jgi:regulator of replication initiation timing